MLNVSYHCGGTVAGVNIVLLDTGITSNGEEGGSRAVIADGSDAISCRHGFIGHSLGADIPRAGLTVMSRVSTKDLSGIQSKGRTLRCTVRFYHSWTMQTNRGRVLSVPFG